MRYIPTKYLKSGHTLASDLILSKNRVMLRRGKSLTTELINRIEILGYQGVYVEDELSNGIKVNDVISSDLKLKTKSGLQDLFNDAEKQNKTLVSKQFQNTKDHIKEIVDDIMLDRHVMVNMIDIRTYDDYTYSHSLNVAILATVVGTVLGLRKQTLCELAMGALLHDIGKIFIDKQILNKPGKLTAEEFEEMKRHSELGFNFLSSNLNISNTSKLTALQHHEKYKGGGYPKGIVNEEIHLFGRIVGVVDVYDALISDRPYRKAMLPSDAIEYIMTGYDTQFDPEIVNALIKKVAAFPSGTCVKLSTGDLAIVVENHDFSSLRPVVKLIDKDKKASSSKNGKYIDLAQDRSALKITIEDIVNMD